MRPSKFTDEQIVNALEQVRNGTPALHVCRQLGITQTTFYRWREKHGTTSATDVQELRSLRTASFFWRAFICS